MIVGVWAVHDPDRPLPAYDDQQALNPGGEELLAGFAEARTVRATIQLALGVIVGHEYITAEDAYVRLRLHASDAGVSLLTAATNVITKAA